MRLAIITITRFHIPFLSQNFGILKLSKERKLLYTCTTLELPDVGNAPYESCIPEGLYYFKPSMFDRGGYMAWGVFDKSKKNEVTGRSDILLHVGNFESNILGCILVGDSIELFGDGRWGVGNSQQTFNQFNQVMEAENIKEAWLHIEEAI